MRIKRKMLEIEEELIGIENSLEKTKKDEKSLDPLQENVQINDLILKDNKKALDKKSKLVNDIVLAVMVKIKDPFNMRKRDVACTNKKNNNDTERGLKISNKKEQKRSDELCLLRKRLLQMKSRLLLKLQTPENAEPIKIRSTRAIQLKRQLIKEIETPEEAADRRRRQAEQVRNARNRRFELETPEQKYVRKEKQNAKRMMKRQQIQAKETPEERIKRLEHAKTKRKLKKKKVGFLSMRTGRIRIKNLDELTS